MPIGAARGPPKVSIGFYVPKGSILGLDILDSRRISKLIKELEVR